MATNTRMSIRMSTNRSSSINGGDNLLTNDNFKLKLSTTIDETLHQLKAIWKEVGTLFYIHTQWYKEY